MHQMITFRIGGGGATSTFIESRLVLGFVDNCT